MVSGQGVGAGGYLNAGYIAADGAGVSYHYHPKGQRRLRMAIWRSTSFPHWQQRGKAAVPLLSFSEQN
jgi:hypothetical protein